ncbi:MAG: DUF3540 domain-containing protein [Desulfotalea sp.]
MDNLARKEEIYGPQLEYGKVISTGENLVVATPMGELIARKAVSCFVAPEVGDTVLLSLDTQPDVWVLSVLERLSSVPKTVELDGDSILRVNNGSLTISAADELNCISKKTALYADETEVVVTTAKLTAVLFTSNVERVKRVAGYVDDISREFTRRVKNYFRFTEEHEECQAESSRILVEETMTIHSKNSVIVSKENVKIDGELIHMG